jgi:hypothetical protein
MMEKVTDFRNPWAVPGQPGALLFEVTLQPSGHIASFGFVPGDYEEASIAVIDGIEAGTIPLPPGWQPHPDTLAYIEARKAKQEGTPS